MHTHTYTHMHTLTQTLKSNMHRLLHRCLIAVYLAGLLLLLPHCCAGQDEYDYDSTQAPDYDYNGTIEYSFYSNSSSEELEDFIKTKALEDEETQTDENIIYSQSPEPTISVRDQASRAAYTSFVLPVLLLGPQLLRLL